MRAIHTRKNSARKKQRNLKVKMGCSSSSQSKDLTEDKKLKSVTNGEAIKQPRAVSAKEYLQSIQDSLAKLSQELEESDNEEKYPEMLETVKEEKLKLSRLKEQRKIEDSLHKEISMEIQTFENYFFIVEVKNNVHTFIKSIDNEINYEEFYKQLAEFRETVKKVPRFKNGTKGRIIWEETYQLLDDIEKTMKTKQDKAEYLEELDSIQEKIEQLKTFESTALKPREIVNNYRTTINNFKNLDQEIIHRKETLLNELEEIEKRVIFQECNSSLNEAKSSLDKIYLEILSFKGTSGSDSQFADITKKLTILKKNCEKIAPHNIGELLEKKEKLLTDIEGAAEKLKIFSADNKRESLIINQAVEVVENEKKSQEPNDDGLVEVNTHLITEFNAETNSEAITLIQEAHNENHEANKEEVQASEFSTEANLLPNGEIKEQNEESNFSEIKIEEISSMKEENNEENAEEAKEQDVEVLTLKTEATLVQEQSIEDTKEEKEQESIQISEFTAEESLVKEEHNENITNDIKQSELSTEEASVRGPNEDTKEAREQETQISELNSEATSVQEPNEATKEEKQEIQVSELNTEASSVQEKSDEDTTTEAKQEEVEVATQESPAKEPISVQTSNGENKENPKSNPEQDAKEETAPNHLEIKSEPVNSEKLQNGEQLIADSSGSSVNSPIPKPRININK